MVSRLIYSIVAFLQWLTLRLLPTTILFVRCLQAKALLILSPLIMILMALTRNIIPVLLKSSYFGYLLLLATFYSVFDSR